MKHWLINGYVFLFEHLSKGSIRAGQLLHARSEQIGLKKRRNFCKTVIRKLIWASPPLAGFALRDYGASPRSYSGTVKSQRGIARYRLYFSGVH